jgi:hypothetical protein
MFTGHRNTRTEASEEDQLSISLRSFATKEASFLVIASTLKQFLDLFGQ